MPGQLYEFRVEGHLPSGWSEWFDGLDIRRDANGQSVLSGILPDQSALHGILARVRDLNLTLISVRRLPVESAAGSGVEQR